MGSIMKKYLLTTASVLAIASHASAADMPAAPRAVVPDALWSGWYLGLQGGVVSNSGSFHDLTFSGGGDHAIDQIGGAVGVNGRWLRQSDSFVYGIEADWMWVPTRARQTWGFPVITATQTQLTVGPDWIATVRGTMGLALNATLVYVTGGVAFGDVRNNNTRFPLGGGPAIQIWDDNSTRIGWTTGFGVAHQVMRAWTVRAEGRYVDLGRRTVDCTTTGPAPFCSIGGANYRGEFNNHLFMGLVGLDFKF